MINLFITSFSQVFFVALNTVFISKGIYIGIIISSFCLSLIWSYNVKKIAISSFDERLIYATGAATGCVFGTFIPNLFCYYFCI